MDEDRLPVSEETRGVRVENESDGLASARSESDGCEPLEQLTAVMDAAWEAGQVTDESIKGAIERFRSRRRLRELDTLAPDRDDR